MTPWRKSAGSFVLRAQRIAEKTAIEPPEVRIPVAEGGMPSRSIQRRTSSSMAPRPGAPPLKPVSRLRTPAIRSAAAEDTSPLPGIACNELPLAVFRSLSAAREIISSNSRKGRPLSEGAGRINGSLSSLNLSASWIKGAFGRRSRNSARRRTTSFINVLKSLPFRSSGFLALEDDNISIPTLLVSVAYRGIRHNIFFVVAPWNAENFFLVSIVYNNSGRGGRFLSQLPQSLSELSSGSFLVMRIVWHFGSTQMIYIISINGRALMLFIANTQILNLML